VEILLQALMVANIAATGAGRFSCGAIIFITLMNVHNDNIAGKQL